MKLIGLVLCMASVFGMPETIADLLPSKKEDVQAIGKTESAYIRKKAQDLQVKLEHDAPIDEIRTLWNQIHSKPQVESVSLMQIQRIDHDEALDEFIDAAIKEITDAYTEAITENRALGIDFADYTMRHKDSELTPSQWYYLQRINGAYAKLWSDPKIEQAANAIRDKKSEPFDTFVSSAPVKSGSYPFTVLTANIIFMPGNYTYFFGGIRPWEERVDRLANKLKSVDPDVLTLQEVFDEAGAQALIERLKGDYVYFYFDIGPHYFGLKVEENGINSGLFVASKFKVENPTFFRFNVPNMQEAVYKGLFEFDITGDQVLAHIGTTHLQPYDDEESKEVRRQEMTLVVDALKKSDASVPRLLLGDINIDWGPEYMLSPLPKYFFDPYNEGRDSSTNKVPVPESTLTDYFEAYLWEGSTDKYGLSRICDYALLFTPEGGEKEKFELKTTLVPLQSVEDREGALSDHQALLLTVDLKK